MVVIYDYKLSNFSAIEGEEILFLSERWRKKRYDFVHTGWTGSIKRQFLSSVGEGIQKHDESLLRSSFRAARVREYSLGCASIKNDSPKCILGVPALRELTRAKVPANSETDEFDMYDFASCSNSPKNIISRDTLRNRVATFMLSAEIWFKFCWFRRWNLETRNWENGVQIFRMDANWNSTIFVANI